MAKAKKLPQNCGTVMSPVSPPPRRRRHKRNWRRLGSVDVVSKSNFALSCSHLVLAALLAGPLVALSCSGPAKHRALKFFFDGIPEPGATTQVGYAPLVETGWLRTRTQKGKPAVAPRKIFPHPPYRDGKCGGCHSRESGQLTGRVEEGLCRTCHRDVPGNAKYVHGPVAVNACTFCHHHHGSPYPKLLLFEPATLCWNCHEQTDLTVGRHHDNIDHQLCVDCHDPHGGGDRFFLKQIQR